MAVYCTLNCWSIAAQNFGVRPMTASSLIESFPKAFKEVESDIDRKA